MIRSKGELKDLMRAFGRGQEVLFALLEGIVDEGGPDESVRLIVSNKRVRAHVAKEIVDNTRITLPVDYGDPSHRKTDYFIPTKELRAAHLQVRGKGRARVPFAFGVPRDEIHTFEVDETFLPHAGLRCPDAAEARTFLLCGPFSGKARIVAVLTPRVRLEDGGYYYLSMRLVEAMLTVEWQPIDKRWNSRTRLLGVAR